MKIVVAMLLMLLSVGGVADRLWVDSQMFEFWTVDHHTYGDRDIINIRYMLITQEPIAFTYEFDPKTGQAFDYLRAYFDFGNGVSMYPCSIEEVTVSFAAHRGRLSNVIRDDKSDFCNGAIVPNKQILRMIDRDNSFMFLGVQLLNGEKMRVYPISLNGFADAWEHAVSIAGSDMIVEGPEKDYSFWYFIATWFGLIILFGMMYFDVFVKTET